MSLREKSNANLRPFNTLPEDEAQAIREKGKKCMKIRAQKRRLLKDITKEFLHMDAPKQIKQKIKKFYPLIEDEDITNALSMVYSLFGKATNKGDPKAFEVLRDTAGEKPRDALDISSDDGSLPKVTVSFIAPSECVDGDSEG